MTHSPPGYVVVDAAWVIERSKLAIDKVEKLCNEGLQKSIQRRQKSIDNYKNLGFLEKLLFSKISKKDQERYDGYDRTDYKDCFERSKNTFTTYINAATAVINGNGSSMLLSIHVVETLMTLELYISTPYRYDYA